MPLKNTYFALKYDHRRALHVGSQGKSNRPFIIAQFHPRKCGRAAGERWGQAGAEGGGRGGDERRRVDAKENQPD